MNKKSDPSIRKQLLQQFRSTWENRGEIQKQILDTVGWAKNSVEQKAKDIAKQSKSNPIVQNHILPLMENEKVKQAICRLQHLSSNSRFIRNVNKYIEDLSSMDTKGQEKPTSSDSKNQKTSVSASDSKDREAVSSSCQQSKEESIKKVKKQSAKTQKRS